MGQTGMAAGSPRQRLYEEARCPVCLDFLQDPVSVDCGHSFCLRCISEFCDKSDSEQSGLFACPQCRGPFKREGFRPNRQLANLVDGLRQLGQVAGPAGVQCARHGLELSRFCEEDQAALCWACDSSPEHRGHRTTPLQEAAQRHQVSCARGSRRALRPIGSGPAEVSHDLLEDMAWCQHLIPRTSPLPQLPLHPTSSSSPPPKRAHDTGTPHYPPPPQAVHAPGFSRHLLRKGRGSLPLLYGNLLSDTC